MKPGELLIPLVTGIFTVGLGILYFRYGRKSGQEKLTSFNKAAIQLLNEYEKIPEGQVTVTFTDDKVLLAGNGEINYDEIDKILSQKIFSSLSGKKELLFYKKGFTLM